MKVAEYSYVDRSYSVHEKSDPLDNAKVQLVLGFGAKKSLTAGSIYELLRQQFPIADIALCSTSGEIYNHSVLDNTISITALQFDKTIIKAASVNIDDYGSSREAGAALVRQITLKDDLCYIMILSDGSKVNGSELVNGVEEVVQHRVPVTGGLAGDGANFVSTLAGLNAAPVSGKIVAIAFYSRDLIVSHGTMGGWEMFGPERTITRSIDNQLFELNGECALDIYKKYLGKYAEDLPGSALLFPLSVKLACNSEPVVRTILSIDAGSKSMVFAGDVPEGSKVRLMKGNFDKLIEAASNAASQTLKSGLKPDPKLAILISCVGRKLILDSRVEEEVEAVHEVLGSRTLMTGFYSYGEISPFSANAKCELHNQTMTITTFEEQ